MLFRKSDRFKLFGQPVNWCFIITSLRTRAHTHTYIFIYFALWSCVLHFVAHLIFQWVNECWEGILPPSLKYVVLSWILIFSTWVAHMEGERERLFSFSRDSFRQIMFFLRRFFLWMFTECLSFTIPLCLFSFFCSHSLYLLSSSFNCGSSLTGMTRMSFGKLIWMWWMLFSPVSLTTFNLTMHITFSFWIPSMT